MSGLANSLTNLKNSVDPADACSVEKIKKTMDQDDRTALDSVLKSAASTRSIHKTLRENGIRIDRQLLNLHRKGLCACSKEAF